MSMRYTLLLWQIQCIMCKDPQSRASCSDSSCQNMVFQQKAGVRTRSSNAETSISDSIKLSPHQATITTYYNHRQSRRASGLQPSTTDKNNGLLALLSTEIRLYEGKLVTKWPVILSDSLLKAEKTMKNNDFCQFQDHPDPKLPLYHIVSFLHGPIKNGIWIYLTV